MYTAGNLTYESDKLVAISALAKHVHGLFGGEIDYLAGLWRIRLPYQLLWQTHGICSRPTKYRSPSWSWASVNGKIDDICEIYHQDERDILVKVNDAHIDNVSEDLFGPVRGGYLIVSGRLARVASTWKSESLEKYEDIFVVLHSLISTQSRAWIDTHDLLLAPDLIRDLYVLPIRQQPGRERRNSLVYCILLQPVEDLKGQYRRLGVYSINTRDRPLFEQAFENFALHAEEQGVYPEAEDESLFQITLV